MLIRPPELARTIALAALVLPTGCGYYADSAKGQFDILRRSRPVPVVIRHPRTPEKLKSQLLLSQRLVEFADQSLHLPAGSAYSTYADLGRDFVVWNLFAAPRLSLEPKEWRYPIVGNLTYRGYFTEEAAQAAARALETEGHDAVVGGVRAYSTLGWFRDPLLNTFIEDSEIQLAELIFHELTHRRIFRKGETAFNEALATAVAEEGVTRWLHAQGDPAALARYGKLQERRARFYAHLDRARRKLEGLYGSALPKNEQLARKRVLLDDLQADYRELHRTWGLRGSPHWLETPLNNAHLVASATYHEHVPVFRSLLKTHEGDLEAFFRAVRALPPVE